MNKKRVLAWIQALESGEFTQVTEHLRGAEDNCFCVWGVACELYRRKTGVGKWNLEGFQIGETWICEPPIIVCKFFGVQFEKLVKYDDQDEYLSGLNDAGYSFSEIAKLMRQQWLGESE